MSTTYITETVPYEYLPRYLLHPELGNQRLENAHHNVLKKPIRNLPNMHRRVREFLIFQQFGQFLRLGPLGLEKQHERVLKID